ncbi:restriction endonuclease subunit S [Lacticaseibacillus rhamnosus]|uniref:restriction endonuclease subunit S n=1 Tax=Lacticaseibacillus rhamnosus TaxID=47715 RepID=UPI0021A4B413|nr:restriction endonuclease subunit S [Lacticaseibacillus rhamnosus]
MNAWEKRKLGELGDTYSGLSGKTKEDFGHGKAKYVTYMNVFTNPVADPLGTEAIEIDSKQNEVRKNDVFFTTSSETPEEVGMSSVWPTEATNLYLNSFCFGYRVFDQSLLNFMFFAQQLRSPSFRKKMIILAQGISRYNISKKKVLEIYVSNPSVSEQNKIGHLLANVDKLIAATQGKLDCLVKVKKALLQHLFDQSIRFKGYSDPWEKRKLIDQLSLLKDGTDGTHKDGNFAFLLSAKNVIQNSIVFDDSDRKISEDDFNDIYANYHIKKNDVLLTIVGTIGRVALFPRLTVPVAFQRSVAILRTKPTLFPYFLALELQTPSIQSKIKSRANMSAQAGIYLGDLKKVIIAIPKSEEQMEIAMSLKRLTNLIAATQSKLSSLESLKKALLQGLFI